MKRLALLSVLLLMATPVLAGDHDAMKTASGWFDMENCAFCKNLVEDPELLHHSTWENHKIANGALYILTVEPAYAESMAKAAAAMEELGMKIQSGKVNPMATKMCGHCMAFGQLMMTGVKMETVKGEAAEVTLMTSDDPAMVTKLHDLVNRDNKEMAAMAQSGHHDQAH